MSATVTVEADGQSFRLTANDIRIDTGIPVRELTDAEYAEAGGRSRAVQRKAVGPMYLLIHAPDARWIAEDEAPL